MTVPTPPHRVAPDGPAATATASPDYAHRLQRLQGARWKRWLDVQAPYRWHVRRLGLGRVLDLGCGVGRNLAHLSGNGVGIDHNPSAVSIARSRGLVAYDNLEWPTAPEARDGTFDAMLIAHVVEHLSERAGADLVQAHLRYVKPGGRVVFITPQERGYGTDATHVRFVGFAEIDRLCAEVGVTPVLRRSFPFPRVAGRLFTYNEFVVVAQRA